MKVVIYSSSSMAIDEERRKNSKKINIPTITDQYKPISEKYPEHEFVVVTCKTLSVLVDSDTYEYDGRYPNLRFIFVDPGFSSDDYTEVILKENPALAIAISNSRATVDWNAVCDSIIAEKLRAKGIKTVCHSHNAALTFMGKTSTHDVLSNLDFNVAHGITVNMPLYKSDRNKANAANVYRDSILFSLEKLKYPLFIKSSAGMNSAGIKIAQNFSEAVEYLDSIESLEDFIAEETMTGELFGTEIQGLPGNYMVLPPFRLSVDDTGISTGGTNCKIGPVTDEKYNIPLLQEMLIRLAYAIGLEGTAQVDLVFDGVKWGIIEVNPRSSGMSNLCCASEGMYPVEAVVNSVLDKEHKLKDIKLSKCIQLPLGQIKDDELEEIRKKPHVWTIFQYSSVLYQMSTLVMNGFETEKEILDYVKELAAEYPHIFTEGIVKLVEKTV